MLFLLSGMFGLGSLATLSILIGKAPEAYETENGLRIVRPPHKVKGHSSRLPVAQVSP
ncbi:MAG: hypothetical protein JO354_09300 [Verrucomicrobia bacterium]|nr:hypothetical protein [Verrucomicrobiota bacterium]